MAEKFLTLMADLDEGSQQRMSEWYAELRKAGFAGTQTPGLPYHVSLSTFSLDQEETAVQTARKAAAEFAPVPVQISHIGLFAGGRTLFAAPEKDAKLTGLHEACRSDTPQQYPWTPHVTLLIDEPGIVCSAVPVFVNLFVPFTGMITRLHLCAFWPAREIAAFGLTGGR